MGNAGLALTIGMLGLILQLCGILAGADVFFEGLIGQKAMHFLRQVQVQPIKNLGDPEKFLTSAKFWIIMLLVSLFGPLAIIWIINKWHLVFHTIPVLNWNVPWFILWLPVLLLLWFFSIEIARSVAYFRRRKPSSRLIWAFAPFFILGGVVGLVILFIRGIFYSIAAIALLSPGWLCRSDLTQGIPLNNYLKRVTFRYLIFGTLLQMLALWFALYNLL